MAQKYQPVCRYPKTDEKQGWKWSADTWISLGAMLIALAGIILACIEGCENRKHERLSVRPKMAISYFYNETEVGYELTSSGLGPALVKWLEVKVDGKPQKDWVDTFTSLGIDYSKATPRFKVPVGIYQPGTDLVIIGVNSNSVYGQVFKAKLDTIDFRICFCSMYEDDCYLSSNDSRVLNVPSSCKESTPDMPFTLPPRTVVIPKVSSPSPTEQK